jgi:hypothetical protein
MRSENLTDWTPEPASPLNGTGSPMITVNDPATEGAPGAEFYRIETGSGQ